MRALVLAVLILGTTPTVWAQDPAASHATPLPGSATGPRDTAKPKDSGTARISGRVVAADTGTPLRRAEINLGGEGLKEGRSTSTDESGRYEFKDLPAGRYMLNAGKAGYGWTPFGQKRPFQPGRPLVLGDGQTLTRIDFALPRGGVVAGRVTDEFGEAVANINVRAMRYSWNNGKRQLSPVNGASTDDRGRYRIFGLAAGDYFISAQPNASGFSMTQSDSRAGFAPTFFPGTPSPTEAQRLHVTPGNEHGSVNFALVPARTVKVSGTVITADGEPASEGFIMLQFGGPDDASFNMTAGAMVQADGSFTLWNIAPGEYVLHVQLRAGDEEESGSLPITVNGAEDVTSLTLATSRPTRISGQVLFDGAPPEKLRPSEFTFWLQSTSPGPMMDGAVLVTKDDWTVQGRAHHGPLLVNANAPTGWTLKSVLIGGEDVTDSGIPTRSGESIDGLQIVLTNRLSSVSGAAVDDLGRPARDYVVVIFPDDSSLWKAASRRERMETPDQQGRFESKNLPPGHYLAAALDYIEEGQQSDPEFLELVRAVSMPFEVAEGEAKTLSLRVARHP